MYGINEKNLKELAKLTDQYVNAEPFPHIVFDNLFANEVLEEIVNVDFGKGKSWLSLKHRSSLKRACNKIGQFSEPAKKLFRVMNSDVFLSYLSQLTTIKNLKADSSLQGGGLHWIGAGGFLGVHADFNKLNDKLDRRLNMLVYLNKDWKREYEGNLELWDKEAIGMAKEVVPIFNRTVIFSTTSDSLHGHPVPVNCPDGMSRKSLALYYYTRGRPAEEQNKKHMTLYKTRNLKPITTSGLLDDRVIPRKK